jgi:hypothetical protein
VTPSFPTTVSRTRTLVGAAAATPLSRNNRVQADFRLLAET